MKKRIALVALSAVLVFSLAIGGTLMLFTAQSETATNVVTLGNLDVTLEETAVEDPVETDWVEIDADNTGLTFDDKAPGAELLKQARVTNTGNNPFYVKIDGTLRFYDAEDKPLTWAQTIAIINEALGYTGPITVEGQNARNMQFIRDALKTNDNAWYGAPVATNSSDAAPEVYGTWYYIGAANSTTLAAVDADASTPTVIDKIIVPSGLGNLAEDIRIELDLKAYAVQSENIDTDTIDGGITEWATFFAGAFPAA